MSEVTYKKIVDVEQIDTLGEGTTLFVNDGGSMKQMGAAALGAVKSVNGVLPDENGNVEDKHLHYIRFLDGSAMVPGMIQCAEYSAVQIRDAFGDAYERPIVIERLVMSASGTTRSVYCQNYTIERDDDGYIYHLNFGDEYADIILNTVLNTITLDPDWVAPEADPEPTGAHQMLVTGADGSVKWEERTHWADSSLDVVLPEVTIDKKIAYLNDYASYTRNLQQGHTYHVVCDGAEYQCSPVWNDALYSYTIGNASLASLGSDTGEPFFINAPNNTQMTIIYFNSEGQHTIAIDEGMIDTVHPLDPKYMPKDYINGLIDSKLEGAGAGGKLTVGYIYNSNYGFYELDESGASGEEIFKAVQSNQPAAVVFCFGNKRGWLWPVGVTENPRMENTTEYLFAGLCIDENTLTKQVKWSMQTAILVGYESTYGFMSSDYEEIGVDHFARRGNSGMTYENEFNVNNTFGADTLRIKDSSGATWKLVVGTDGALSTEAVTDK